MQQTSFHPFKSYSAFTLATSELCQTGVVLFLKVDSSTTTGTSQVLATVLISNFKNKIKLVWPGSTVYPCAVMHEGYAFVSVYMFVVCRQKTRLFASYCSKISTKTLCSFFTEFIVL